MAAASTGLKGRTTDSIFHLPCTGVKINCAHLEETLVPKVDSIDERNMYTVTHEQRSVRDYSPDAKREAKTYNSGYSLVVTHLTTNPPVRCLNRAERTGSLVFNVLWSYVINAQFLKIISLCMQRQSPRLCHTLEQKASEDRSDLAERQIPRSRRRGTGSLEGPPPGSERPHTSNATLDVY